MEKFPSKEKPRILFSRLLGLKKNDRVKTKTDGQWYYGTVQGKSKYIWPDMYLVIWDNVRGIPIPYPIEKLIPVRHYRKRKDINGKKT